jgi:molybdopterin-guanine dinucleotide biosynthesis protein A
MGRPKQALRLPNGKTMVEAVAAVLAEVCRRVVVVGGADAPPGVRHIDDLRRGEGPLAGIEALLASGLDTQYLVCPCDVPLVTGSLLLRLTAGSRARATVFRIEGDDAVRPLPARVSVEALEAVRGLLDHRRRAVHQLMASIGPEVIVVSQADAGQLTNINTLQEYEALCRATDRP